jgi:hypothetical protein
VGSFVTLGSLDDYQVTREIDSHCQGLSGYQDSKLTFSEGIFNKNPILKIESCIVKPDSVDQTELQVLVVGLVGEIDQVLKVLFVLDEIS